MGLSTISAQGFASEGGSAYYCLDKDLGRYIIQPLPCDEEVCIQACKYEDCPYSGPCESMEYHIWVEHTNTEDPFANNEEDVNNPSLENNPYTEGVNGYDSSSSSYSGSNGYSGYSSTVTDALLGMSNPMLLALKNLASEAIDKLKSDLVNDAKAHISEIVTSSAEEAYKLYGTLNGFMNDHPWLKVEVQKVVGMLKNSFGSVYSLPELDEMDWSDLFFAWLFEIDNIYAGNDGKNKFVFGPDAWTTHELMHLEGVNIARNLAIANIQNGSLNKVQHQWTYGVNQFYEGIASLDIATSFLGTYTTSVEIQDNHDGSYTLLFKVENSSSWVSATRLRKGEKPEDDHQGIIGNTERHDSSSLGLGGDMAQEWYWTETYWP